MALLGHYGLWVELDALADAAPKRPLSPLQGLLAARCPGFDWAGGTYGQHTMDVLEGMLGYDLDRVAELAAAQVLE